MWTPASEAVTIKGTPLSNIPDIVKTVTSSDFPELQKHSILLYERYSDTGGVKYQPCIFTVSNDGSMIKQYELIGHNENRPIEPIENRPILSPRANVVQKMDVSVSNKRFGKRRNVFYSIAGIENPYYSSACGLRTIETSGTESSANINAFYEQTYITGDDMVSWGNACLTVKGRSEDIFVRVDSNTMGASGSLHFRFYGLGRNETGQNGEILVDVKDFDGLGWKIFDYNNGIRGVGIAGGDFDGDGWKNDIALCFNDDDYVYAYFYSVTLENGQLNVQHRYHVLIHDGGYWTTGNNKQASPNVVAGDFNGDGKDEAAFVNKTFPQGEAQNQMRVTVINYNKKNDSWEVSMAGISGLHESACKVTRCDFDGDGKDELAILFFQGHDGALWPRLERWYCDNGSIQPIRGSTSIGGSNADVLGYYVAGGVYNEYYKIAEDFCITAGPVTGTKGKTKLAEDIVISHVNEEASRVFVIPTQLDASYNFAGFGKTKTVYNVSGNDSARRGAVITGDFANESLMLDKPSHKVSNHDESYVAVLQAFPYHLDNVDINGNRTSYLINYTFSGFNGDEGNGEMNVAYSKTQSSQSEQDVSFGMASTTETIGVLGSAGEFEAGTLKFATTAANIAGNFDERAKTAGEVMGSIMDLVTDNINTTTTEATKEAHQRLNVTSLKANAWDAIYRYSAKQHIWRYKILNNPLPSWYKLGPKADDSSPDVKTDSKEHYITFSMYDDAILGSESANQTNTYQPIHEEGNLFSYPSDVTLSEGYNPDGLLDSVHYAVWTKDLQLYQLSKFTEERIKALKYDENIERSELTKTVSAIGAFFGVDADPFPPYTSHNRTFTKSFSTSEQIEFSLLGRSTEHGEYAGNTLYFVPYLAREGTMKVAMAVTLASPETSPLWGSNSLYRKLPDPALLLPGKYKRVGATLAANDVAGSAMRLRGMRFYVPELDLHSNVDFLAGLTYKVRVPLYNASFLDTGKFDVRLSYARAGKTAGTFDKEKPYIISSLKEIETLHDITMGGWDNNHSDNNKKWIEFTFKVPKDTEEGEYVFYVQIDPDKKLQEVHESRMDSAGNLLDLGGNNEGYFSFTITPYDKVRSSSSGVNASVRASGAMSSRGTIYRAVSRKSSGNAEGAVFSSESGLGTISTMSTFGGVNGLDLPGLLAVFGEGYSNGVDTETIKAEDDATYSIVMDITYDGDEYHPEAYLCGYNYKAGALDSGDFEVDHLFLKYKIALVPHETTTVVINLSKEHMDYVNGTGFEIVIPELGESVRVDTREEGSSEAPSGEDNPITVLPSSSGGCETGTGIFAVMILAGAAILGKMKRK